MFNFGGFAPFCTWNFCIFQVSFKIEFKILMNNFFCHFRSLKCDRLRVHKNFMVSLIIRYTVSVIYYEPYIYGNPQRKIWFRDFGEVKNHFAQSAFTRPIFSFLGISMQNGPNIHDVRICGSCILDVH